MQHIEHRIGIAVVDARAPGRVLLDRRPAPAFDQADIHYRRDGQVDAGIADRSAA